MGWFQLGRRELELIGQLSSPDGKPVWACYPKLDRVDSRSLPPGRGVPKVCTQ
jgi:hypothetical protein